MGLRKKIIAGISLYCFLLAVVNAQTNQTNQIKWSSNNADINIRIIARTQDQMAAFYEARGFPRESIKKLKDFCFFTVGISNKSQNIIHHNLNSWSFTSRDVHLKRFHRNTLKSFWLKAGLEKPLVATFRWTLLPEQLDFRPQESEGGNIVLSRSQHPFDIHVIFNKEKNNSLKRINIKLNKIQCADNEKEK